MKITIDGNKAETRTNLRYRGPGMVSANNSSRLLLDYRQEHPQAYYDILRRIFTDDGIGVTHLKLEMGADINSSSGTEPSTMRWPTERADVTRGAGFRLAADAKTLNPELTLDLLPWGEPRWVSDAPDQYDARYRWYKETLCAAWDAYRLRFDYVSAVRNEREADPGWVKYLSRRLKDETDSPYAFSAIKIVAGDEVCTWGIADRMLEDRELMEAIDVVGSHYTSWSSTNAQRLALEFGKELWLSEGSTPMAYSTGTARFGGSGLSGLNGALDIANRFITMVSGGLMTACQYQPVVAAYYDGVTYSHKQFIEACDPWSGYYSLESGFFMSLHFSRFFRKGWTFVLDACMGDGEPGGDGHCIVDAVHTVMTASDPESGDYSVVLTNPTETPLHYDFTVSNLGKAVAPLAVWETRGGDSDAHDERYFRRIATIIPVQDETGGAYSLTIAPYSIVTVTTLERERPQYKVPPDSARKLLRLPYVDDFAYAGYPARFLASRGGAPRYTTDQGGAFEVSPVRGRAALVQRITEEIKAHEWGWTPDPTTNFGDDRWFNYSVSAEVLLAEGDTSASCYAGIGLRYVLACNGQSGYWLKLFGDGRWCLMKNGISVGAGALAGFDASLWTPLRVEAVENTISAWIDGNKVCSYYPKGESVLGAGRAAFYSSYDLNSFANLCVASVPGLPYAVQRFDDTDRCCVYAGDWNHATMSGYRNFRRTISTGKAGSSVSISFTGTAFSLCGETAEGSRLTVEIDGMTVEESYVTPKTSAREISYRRYGLTAGEHAATITILEGEFCMDGVEISGVSPDGDE